ncbi:MAG: RNase adapter RapZ [Acetobacteraceae bacterium]|nr:RNase adapter RapZ [Acetobacteraceae bacterium]
MSPRKRVVIVSGLSGAGKASTLHALEDIGFEAIDNPPLSFVEELVARPGLDGMEGQQIAFGVDARSRGFKVENVLSTLERLRANPAIEADLVFAWAEEGVLQRRFTETRRRHPLAPEGRVQDGIAAEQALTAPLREAADLMIDTSDLSLAGLRQIVEQRYGNADEASDKPRAPGLAVSLMSFGYPLGLPREADVVMDARFLRNPHYDPLLRPSTGLDPAVAAYVEADPIFAEFYDRLAGMLLLLLPRFRQEGKKYATIAIGCTGGRHRSVAIVEKLAATLSEAGWRVSITHRELARERAALKPAEPAKPAAPAEKAHS